MPPRFAPTSFPTILAERLPLTRFAASPSGLSALVDMSIVGQRVRGPDVGGPDQLGQPAPVHRGVVVADLAQISSSQ